MSERDLVVDEFEPTPQNKSELISQIERSRGALLDLVHRFSEAQRVLPGPNGWSIKDHLAHLAAWEAGMAARILDRPRWEAMGLSKEDLIGKNVEEINEKIFKRYKDTPLEQVEAFFDLAHQLMLAALEQTRDKDLSKRYPTRSDPTEGATLLSFIAGDTYEHYREHVEWIRPHLPNGGR